MIVEAVLPLDDFLVRNGLMARAGTGKWTRLTGGVSSDIWKVQAEGRVLCIKRALPKLKVDADWYASTARNSYEWAWLKFAAKHAPNQVPTPLAHDAEAGIIAMSFLAPADYPNWKVQLLEGHVSEATAAAVGDLVGRLHASSASDGSLVCELGDLASFEAIRLDPYLRETARRHPRLSSRLNAIADDTARTRKVAVHGDVSPKNLLVGPWGPVLLDAEAAWFGDPAFDLAFCLNHLLLKAVARPDDLVRLIDAFRALAAGYVRHVDWEPVKDIEARAARLLPALLLARVDGKSPVEYVSTDAQRNLIRDFAEPRIDEPPQSLQSIADAWTIHSGAS